MGHEITYCAVCHEQIRWQDIQKAQAFKLEDRIFCLACGPDVLRSLPPGKMRELFQTLTASPATSPRTPRPAKSTVRMEAVAASKSRAPLALGAGAGAVVLALILWIGLGSSPAPAPPAPPSRTVAPPARPPAAVAPAPKAQKAPPSAAPETAAQEALRKAREWAAANPGDFEGCIRKYQEACFATNGTPAYAEASAELEKLRAKQRDFFAKELAALEPEVSAACARERFLQALDLLGAAKERHASSEWHLLVGKRTREVNDAAFRLLNTVKEQALEARGRGDLEKVKELRARVAGWGVARFIKEFREAVDE